jgi:hypothetical protein
LLASLPQKLPLDVVQKIRQQIGKRFVPWNQQDRALSVDVPYGPESFRILNRSDYGYYRSDLQNINILISHTGDESIIGLDKIYDKELYEAKIKAIRKAYNVEQHALESIKLQNVIAENSVVPHLQAKKYLKEK